VHNFDKPPEKRENIAHSIYCSTFWKVSTNIEPNPCTKFSSSVSLLCVLLTNTYTHTHTRRPFAKFVDSPYYPKLELCGGAVTVSFSKYLPWQVMHFLQHSIYFLKMYCIPFAASFMSIVEWVVLTLELHFHGWKSQKSHEPRSRLHGGWYNEVVPISVSTSLAPFQSCNTAPPLRLLLPS
jgi:hypothetical protein